jgi:chaperone modulatory protein CbpM
MREPDVLSRVEGLTETRLRVSIEQAWVRPARDAQGHRFDEVDAARLRLICELCDDMEVNEAAVPVVLSLIDRLHRMRRDMRVLEQAIAAQDEAVRATILAALREAGGDAVTPPDA